MGPPNSYPCTILDKGLWVSNPDTIQQTALNSLFSYPPPFHWLSAFSLYFIFLSWGWDSKELCQLPLDFCFSSRLSSGILMQYWARRASGPALPGSIHPSSEAEKPMHLSPGVNHSQLDANSGPCSQFYVEVGKEIIESRLSCLRSLLPIRGIPLPALGENMGTDDSDLSA